jgi:hypothetical protein
MTVMMFVFVLLQFLQQRQPVHSRHVDVCDDQADITVRLQRCQSLDAVVGKRKTHGLVPDLMPEFLQDERL